MGEEFACRTDAALANFSFWNGKEWTMAIPIDLWKPDYKPDVRLNQERVVWREVQP